jgi:Spy/CpxP family protein refolding chaperone
MKTLLIKSLALSLTLATLAGCGQSALSTAALVGTDTQANANGFDGPHGRGGKGQMGPQGDKGGAAALFQTLNLTEDQKTQLQAIAEKYKPAAPADQAQKPERPEAKLQALLVAETLDVEAIKAALTAQPPAPPAGANDNRLKMLVEARAVLTEDQRNQLVAQLQAQPSPRPLPSGAPQRPDAPDASKIVDQLAAKVSLTDEQKAALKAFLDAQAANRPAAPAQGGTDPRAAERAALIAFIQTGETAGLTPAAPAARPAFPVDAFLAFATSLSYEQRKAVFAQGGLPLMGGPGGPGGERGHGGPGGPGGPGGERGGHEVFGGFGGFGGPRPDGPQASASPQA